MFVEERIYTVQPGRAPDFLRLYEQEGMAIQLRHLPAMVGYYTSEIGALNLVVHLWAFEDLNHRVACRTRMIADPDWQNYLKKLMPLILHQESRILQPAPFFQARLQATIEAGRQITTKSTSSLAASPA